MDCLENLPSSPFELPSWLGIEDELRLASSGLATATLVVLLVCSSREALAQSGATAGSLARGGQSVELVSERALDAAATAPAGTTDSLIRRVRELDALLAVRGHGRAPITAQQTDAAIAEAVALGLERELEKKSGFRKRNADLFRAQRSVQLGDQEMELRLRLRAKTRDAMAVELRF